MTRKEYERRWRKRNPDKVRGKAVRWRARHPLKYKAYHKARRATLPSRYHGLTYAQILRHLRQQGACGICRTKTPGKSRWHGDHSHATGKFRGVLCQRCNMGLGLFRDDPVLVRKAQAYLRRTA